MYRFVEYICYNDAQLHHLSVHQYRLNRNFDHFFPEAAPFNLANILPEYELKGKHKIRVEYDDQGYFIDIAPYVNPDIRSLATVVSDEVYYPYKSLERVQLDDLWDQKGDADDIIIVRDGLVTDSYYANLAFYRNGKWFTPETPLLKGVRRQVLLDSGRIIPRVIKQTELHEFEKVSLINAMLDLEEVVVNEI